jgi:TatD DNase family protein
MNYWTDTHCHIYSTEFDADRTEVLNRAFASGVERILMPNVDAASIDAMFAVEEKFPDRCLPMMGLHPCSVKEDVAEQLLTVEQWLEKRKFVALGEMGTDLYWDKTFWEQQQEAFRIQVGWAKKYRLPIVIHCRASMNETLDLLEPLNHEHLTGVFHCFSGTEDQVKRVADLGFYFGIGGIATFKNSGLDAILPHIPSDRLVLETDSPYLAPVPYRGKRNEPDYIPVVAAKVSQVLGVSMEDLKKQTTHNAHRLFGFA